MKVKRAFGPCVQSLSSIERWPHSYSYESVKGFLNQILMHMLIFCASRRLLLILQSSVQWPALQTLLHHPKNKFVFYIFYFLPNSLGPEVQFSSCPKVATKINVENSGSFINQLRLRYLLLNNIIYFDLFDKNILI